jgi:septum formation protein
MEPTSSRPALILASQSPRRRELMGFITPDFSVQVSDADETIAPGTPPGDAVEELALRKARAVLALQPDPSACLVVGADTVVAVEGRILGKPRDRQECLWMLSLLSGREHTVFTGVAILGRGAERSFREEARVEFWPLTGEEMEWYASTPEPYDKAGGYGIQGLGSVLVKGIRGDFFTVMGLPVARLWRELRQAAPEAFPLGEKFIKS